MTGESFLVSFLQKAPQSFSGTVTMSTINLLSATVRRDGKTAGLDPPKETAVLPK